ncbi:hypothetical protein ACS5PU_18220 [Pedobacter sp. GSP4]|uniref:hypothetical protein n=1 Tax=Pedobacter sp. GSP4 TaxID=3453716 RepID=UPI003EEE9E0F
MSWNSLAGNQTVSGNNLLDAIGANVFVLKPNQSIPNSNKSLTREQVSLLIEIYDIPTDQKLVLKNELIAKPVYTNISVPDSSAFMICNNEQYIFISEKDKHRVIRYPIAGGKGVVIAGNGNAGAGDYQLNSPLGLDIVNNYLMIADSGNKRVVYCSAVGTPGNNFLTTIINCATTENTTGFDEPVHVSGQVFSAASGLQSLVSCRLISSGSNKPVTIGTANLNNGGLTFTNNFPNGNYDFSGYDDMFIQYTDIGTLRANYVTAQSGNFNFYYRSYRFDSGQTDTFRIQNAGSEPYSPFAFLWVPFNVGTGFKKLISVFGGYLRVHVNNGTGNVEKTLSIPSWMSDIKGMSAQKYPSLDGNGYPRKPVFILAGNRVCKWMDDVFTEIPIGIEPNYYLLDSNAYANYSSPVDACTIEPNGDEYFALFTTNAFGYVNIGDTLYVQYSGAYHIINIDYSYISYSEFGQKIWIRINPYGVITEKGSCSFSKNFSIYQTGRRLLLTADDGAIANDLGVVVEFTVRNNSNFESPTDSCFMQLSAGTTYVESSDIIEYPSDIISINYISFTPANSSGYTIYVNGYSGND